jgi:2-polyprenyl-3-methyl-5-hydroxy-6-metoxy-1,4-benzoquinol methylase
MPACSEREPRIADIGCGAGWSSISLANAYPHVRVDGFDLDDASIADARRNANEARVADRIRFEVRDAVSEPAAGERAAYDLVTIFEALHDMAHPVDALKACRAMLRSGGIVVVMDERVADTFAESDGPFERFLYGASSLHCLPVGMSDSGSAGTGALMRPETLRRYATDAGFSRVDVLAIEHDMYRFYALVP